MKIVQVSLFVLVFGIIHSGESSSVDEQNDADKRGGKSTELLIFVKVVTINKVHYLAIFANYKTSITVIVCNCYPSYVKA
jgi:hypothetical protein